MLVEAWRYLEGRIRVTIMNYESDQKPTMMSRDRHLPIVDAIERGDLSAAVQVVEQHMAVRGRAVRPSRTPGVIGQRAPGSRIDVPGAGMRGGGRGRQQLEVSVRGPRAGLRRGHVLVDRVDSSGRIALDRVDDRVVPLPRHQRLRPDRAGRHDDDSEPPLEVAPGVDQDAVLRQLAEQRWNPRSASTRATKSASGSTRRASAARRLSAAAPRSADEMIWLRPGPPVPPARGRARAPPPGAGC